MLLQTQSGTQRVALAGMSRVQVALRQAWKACVFDTLHAFVDVPT